MKYTKSLLKVLIIIVIVFVNLLIFSYFPVNARLTANQLNGNLNNTEEIKPLLASVLEVTSIIASAVSIVTLILLGIKYMMGSIEEKAEYKKTLLPYVIGAIFVFGASTIASVIYNMF